MSLFFDVDNFTDRIMVTLTTLLVVATMGSSIQAVRRHTVQTYSGTGLLDVFPAPLVVRVPCYVRVGWVPLLPYGGDLHAPPSFPPPPPPPQSLPKTSYYKLIDWWLLYILVVLVLTMALHTYVAYVCFTDKAVPVFSLFGGRRSGEGGN